MNSSNKFSGDKMQDDIKKTGYLKKLKTMKKKFFILRMESESGPSRLEYHDSEKKWRTGNPPKRMINLKTCFNINRKLDTKQKFVIALYTKDDSFAIALDNEAELDDWLTALLQMQRGGEYFGTSQIPKPNFEHVWQVTVKSRGLGSSKNILGEHRLCLTERTLSLVRMSAKTEDVFEFPLVSIRRCGNSDSFFFMEVGRSAMTGAGELWMLTEDTLIAQNMHETILNAMKCSHRDEMAPRQRSRSNEASKPISVHLRRQQTNPIPAHMTSRERADSMPTRVRTISDGAPEGSLKAMHMMANPYRPSSMIAHTLPSSPPYGLVSKSHDNHALDSGESSMSIDDCDSSQPDILLQRYGSSLPEDSHMEPTTEEDLTQDESYMAMAPGEAESKHSYSRDTSGYMEMDPSVGLDIPLTPPRCETVSSVSHSRDPSLTSPPSWLALGSSGAGAAAARMASSPPPPAHHQQQQPSSHGSDYLEMASPGAASSIGTPEGYMPMSPVGSLYIGAAAAASNTTSNISPRPTTYKVPSAEKPKGEKADSSNGYVPMAPVKDIMPTIFKGHSPQEDEGYLDMNPASHSSSKKATSGEDMSRRSSGTPSTDICFSEYPLDKVRSYFTPTDEDEPIVRAYSIGSRADCDRRNKLDVSDSSRTRAFSVGSKVGVKFGSKLSSGSGSSTSSTATPKTAAAGADDKGKKSNSAPILGTSPLCNSWTGNSFLHRIHSTSRSSQNEDLMEMDFPEGSNRGSGNVNQGFWPDGTRKSGAVSSGGSSTDSLRRTPTGSRPRANSRSSHPRTSKLETLKSIGEKSSSKSPPSESAVEPTWVSPPATGDYMEMNHGAGDSGGTGATAAAAGGTAAKPSLTKQASRDDHSDAGTKKTSLTVKHGAPPNRDYVNMNAKRGESMDKGGADRSGATSGGDRKCSLPVSIQGSRLSGRRSPADPSLNAGEYVSIDFSRGYSAMPQKFAPTATAVAPHHHHHQQQQKPQAVTVAGKISSNQGYTSVRFPSTVVSAPTVTGAVSAVGPTVSTDAYVAAARSPTLPHLTLGKPETKPTPEYVNLNYDRRASAGGHAAAPLAATPMAMSATSNTLSPANSVAVPTTRIGATAASVAAMATSVAAPATTTGTTSASRASQLSQLKFSDYTIMSPIRPLGSSATAASSTSSSSPLASPDSATAGFAKDTKTGGKTSVSRKSSSSSSSCTSPTVSTKAAESRGGSGAAAQSTKGASRRSSSTSASPSDADSNGNYAEVPDAAPSSSFSEVASVSPSDTVSSNSAQESSSPLARSSRPSSVSSERELNYASLDLASGGSAADEIERSPRSPRSSKSGSLTGGSSSADEANAVLSYAKIDFAKSDGLRCAAAAARENRV